MGIAVPMGTPNESVRSVSDQSAPPDRARACRYGRLRMGRMGVRLVSGPVCGKAAGGV